MTQDRLTLEQLEYQNVIFIMIKYIDTMLALNESSLPAESELALTIKASLLGYGITHAARGTGLFTDIYHRESSRRHPEVGFGFRFGRKVELYDTLRDVSADKTLLAISPAPIASYIVHRLFPTGLVYQHSFLNMLFLAVPSNDVEATKDLLQPFGIYPTMDTQLLCFAAKKSFEKNIYSLIQKAYPPLKKMNWLEFIELIKVNYYPTVTTTVAENKNNIEQMLTHARSLTYADNQLFYFTSLLYLISPLRTGLAEGKEDHETHFANLQIHLAFNRLHFLVMQLIEFSASYPRFLSLVEYCFDELKMLMGLLMPYEQPDILSIWRAFIEEQYQLNHVTYTVDTMLAGSGMQGITNLLYSAVKEVMLTPAYKNGEKSGKIAIVNNVYYEITHLLSAFLGVKIPTDQNDLLIEFSKVTNQATLYQDELVDILVGDFKKNVQSDSYRHESTDLIRYINRQFELRQHQATAQPLITVLDTTMNAFDDSHMTYLLAYYEDKIARGELVIVTGCSLNKYFHLGTDKTPAGLYCGFYLAERFSAIKTCFSASNGLDTFPARSPTLQFITHSIRYNSPHILAYCNIITGNTRFVHAKLVPKRLLNPQEKIFVLSPSTPDIYQDYWGFVVIRINDNPNNKHVLNILFACFTRLMSLLDISKRDGYGFNLTTYISIMLNRPSQILFRVSIGTENYATLRHKINPLMDFIEKANQIFSSLTLKESLQNYLPALFAATHILPDNVLDTHAIDAIKYVLKWYFDIAMLIKLNDHGGYVALLQEINFLTHLLPASALSTAKTQKLLADIQCEYVAIESKLAPSKPHRATLFSTTNETVMKPDDKAEPIEKDIQTKSIKKL